VGAAALRAELLGLVVEREVADAAAGLAVELHAADLGEDRLAGRLAVVGAALACLRSLQGLLPAGNPSRPAADAP
jgi:hypothetical protein